MKKNIKPNYRSGQAILLALVLFMSISLSVLFAIGNPAMRNMANSRGFDRSGEAFYVSEAVNNDALYRLKTGKNLPDVITLSSGGYQATATTSASALGKDIISKGESGEFARTIFSSVVMGTGVSFHYGIQSGKGGFVLDNSSSVQGNVYSNGEVEGSGDNEITGDLISAGPTGLIDGVYVTGSAYAHAISNSTVQGNAYYSHISGTVVHGTSFPGSADQATTTLPISDEQVEEWKADALAGGEINSPCPYVISSNTTIGPKKINCNLSINGTTVTLTGALWVNGNITISNSSVIKVSPTLPGRSIPVIADKPADNLNSGKINIANNTQFQGAGAGSYVLLLSQNKSAENGGSQIAVTAQNSINGALLLYAGHGEIKLQNSATMKEVTAYRIRLQNSARVVYESGLANLLFSSGPGGGFELGRWKEE